VLKCEQCHTEIGQEITENRGLHSKFPNKIDCAKCHSEHNGEDFPLIHWEPSLKGFDHNQTGYPLQGKHAGLECSQCHTPAHLQASVKPLIRMKDLKQTFLGLTQDCASCHQDVHKGQLGQNCLQCHNYTDWKTATHFDHSKTRYPLTGLHAQVACEKCHAPAKPGEPARFTGIPFAKCSDCHADPHHEAFKQNCETCHTTSGWKKVPTSEQFDHSKTKFPLLGKHAEVDCLRCHAGGNFEKPVPFAKCSDCHAPDPHKGQFSERPDKGECGGCHTVDGWKPSLFGVKEHASAAYPLTGKHLTLECAKCHIPAGPDTKYRIPFEHCLDCHKDAHNGQFAVAPYKNECERCHTVQGFQPSTYTIALHQKTRFPLAGAHLAVICAECHRAGFGGAAPGVIPYHFGDRTCTGCHADPHHGEFNDKMAQKRKDGTSMGCEACHTVKSWTDLPSFDHSKTSFPLLGAHMKVACDQCHKPAGPEGKITEVSFKSTPAACSGCHADIHAGQFVKAGKPLPCERCHDSKRWKPSNFDHETGTDFSLKGAHEKVACGDCHNGYRIVNGKRVLFYRPTPRQCVDCHE